MVLVIGVSPGYAGLGSTRSIGGVGIATVVRVGVAFTTSRGTPNVQFIGTAAVTNGRVVSIAITQTDPVPGFTGVGSSTFNAIIDEPLPYQDIPLWYDNASTPGTGWNSSKSKYHCLVLHLQVVVLLILKSQNTGFWVW